MIDMIRKDSSIKVNKDNAKHGMINDHGHEFYEDWRRIYFGRKTRLRMRRKARYSERGKEDVWWQ